MDANTKKALFSFFDTANRFFSDTGSPPAVPPEFTGGALPANSVPDTRTDTEAGRIRKPDGHFTGLQDIAGAVLSCQACGLSAGRKHAVPGEGVADAFVMVIGEGPGAEEDLQGRPFVGRSGQLLDKMLAAVSLSRTVNVFIANIVKCRPPGNRDPQPEESEACAGYLAAQIAYIKPKAILALGRIASRNLLATNEGITRLRGRFFDYRGIPLMPTYHPSALLRDENLKRPAWEDLKRFREKLRELEPGYEAAFAVRRETGV